MPFSKKQRVARYVDGWLSVNKRYYNKNNPLHEEDLSTVITKEIIKHPNILVEHDGLLFLDAFTDELLHNTGTAWLAMKSEKGKGKELKALENVLKALYQYVYRTNDELHAVEVMIHVCNLQLECGIDVTMDCDIEDEYRHGNIYEHWLGKIGKVDRGLHMMLRVGE